MIRPERTGILVTQSHKLRREDGALSKSVEVENRKAALFRASREFLDEKEVYALSL
jgi:hypothetical protein